MSDHAPATAGRRIALIAHDNKKRDMLKWAEYNLDLLAGHELFATATTGHILQQLGLPVTCYRSGPYGGDQQIGARIAEGDRAVGEVDLYRGPVPVAGPDAQDAVQRAHPDLAVADRVGPGMLGEQLDQGFRAVIRDH